MLFTSAGSVHVKYVRVHALVRHVISWPEGDQDVGFRRNTDHFFFFPLGKIHDIWGDCLLSRVSEG